MPKNTYDDIVRRTVPEPDTSWRPSPEQVKQAHEGFRALDADEQRLQARVRAALAASGITGVEAEITADRVTLRGQVADADTLNRASEIVRGVDGVGDVADQLVIAAQ
jgi:osmotically-inducible protein OsmY